MIAATRFAKPAGRFDIAEPPTTDGRIALLNLDAQIDGLESDAASSERDVASRVALIELITLRGLILGRVSDYERAEAIAQQLVRDAADDETALVARSRIRAVFHRFTDALDDLDLAELLSLDPKMANDERAAIFQALGRHDEAFAIREEAAVLRPSFETLGALAGLCGERGATETAERLYLESLGCYRGVSPFPVALLNFQFGLMWMKNGRLDEARTWFDAARRRVPAYAAAKGHLAEVEAELGEIETAVARLQPLAASSEDPDYAAQLARILGDAGQSDESRRWGEFAAGRYDELVARHPEAFADHAAEFWLATGADPNKALLLARMNFELRKTPRARDLLSRAIDGVARRIAKREASHGDTGERKGADLDASAHAQS